MSCTCYSKLHHIATISALNLALLGFIARSQAIPNFGPNVFVFNPSIPAATIQSNLDYISGLQANSGAQFGANRYAILFEPGTYNVSINLGYYMQVLGLGQSPDEVTINGALDCNAFLPNGNATCNFWLSAENLAVASTNGYTMWAVSQGTSFRRMHVENNLFLCEWSGSQNWASGGFLADSEIDGSVNPIGQQQWFSRNDRYTGWTAGNWNFVFLGDSSPPPQTWPGPYPSYTVISNVPLIRQKPYLFVDSDTNFFVLVPNLTTNSVGPSWASGPTPGVSVPISQFYLARPGTDNAGSINAALNSGLNLILTPGIYHLTNSILVTNPDTIVFGLGFPTLVPTNGNPAMVIADVDGVKVSGILFDAGTTPSPALLEVGPPGSSLDHSADPICLYDVHSRVGGQFVGTTTTCFTINANNVIGDNLWLWRADHGNSGTVGWTVNASDNGLVVNGNHVTIYGLFVEHHEQYQTLWNGNWGRVYFYQSELPYDAPNQSAWTHNGVNGYASYKVANGVTSHQAYGLGVYGVFQTSNVKCFNAIETPTNAQQVNVHDMINVLIAAQTGSEMTHIINGTGATLTSAVTTATANYLWPNPAFYVSAGMSGPKVAISFPSESWHFYQLQDKNSVADPSWSNLGGRVGGNDALQTIIDPTPAASRFYRVVSY